MRYALRLMFSFGLGTMALVTSLSAFSREAVVLIVNCIRDAMPLIVDFIPRLAERAQPMRRIDMAATALNGRQVGGVRVHGFLGYPAVRTLAS